MKKSIIVLVIVATVSICQASPLPDYPLVFARGEAQAEMVPDICEVSYRIKVRDESSTNALSTIEERSSETLVILSLHGVKKGDVVGYEINKDRVRDYEKSDQLQFLGYEMTRRIEFKLRDLDKYDPVLSTLIKTPDVVDIQTSFNRGDRKEVESRLLAEAVSNAKTKAELMAQGSNQKIVKLRAISQDGFYSLGQRFGFGYDGDGGSVLYSMSAPPKRELLYVPSTIEFRSSVSVIYEIKQKD